MIQPASSAAAPSSHGTPQRRPASAFQTFLSELNPLQYLPVVGTIYRAVTGDAIPEAARIAGSSVVSFLTGGPVGLAIGLGATLLEKAAGIDSERIGQHLLAGIGIGQATGKGAEPALSTLHAAPPATAWTRGQLASYGIDRTAEGDCRCGALVGAEVLNTLELKRLHVLA